MAQKTTTATIIDHVDGQPSIILANGNWGVFDPKTKEYKDTGVKATAIDDNSAVKYFKLTNTSASPTAPNKAGGYANIKPELDDALVADGWSLDPLTPSKNNKFCWIAVYGMENILDVEATQTNGAMTFKQKFTLRTVGLWANYSESPTIEVKDGVITIKNPDGTITSQQFVTKDRADDLTTMVNALQEQVDGAIYSYSMEGVPTMDTAPVTDWRIEADLSDNALIADIYKTHVGDTYTDTLTFFSYRFAQTGASASNPAHYGWKIIENDALTAALGEIANLGKTKMTIFTVKPDHGKYKAGDMWLQSDNTMMVAIADGDNKNFNPAHWIQPFATKAEVSAVQSDLDRAKADAQATANNLNKLKDSLGNLTDGVGKAIKDNIITAAELRDLQAFSDALDVEQAKMLSTVTYLLSSKFLPSKNNDAIVAIKARFLDTGGSIDQLQKAILKMDANNNGVIDEDERANYNTKLGIYKEHATEMENAISDARKAIDLRLEVITDEKVNAIQIGGRNLLLNSGQVIKNSEYRTATYLLSKDALTLKTGDEVTLVIKGKLAENKSRFALYNSGGNVEIPLGISHSDFVDGIAYVTGAWIKTNDAGQNTQLYIFAYYKNSVGESEIEWVKLVRGNKTSRDWVEAPEDVQAEIDAFKDFSNKAFADGVVDRAEAKAIEKYINTVNESFESIKSTYDKMLLNPLLIAGEQTKLTGKFTPLNTAKGNLMTAITTAIADGKATPAEKADVDTKFGLYNTAMKAYQTALEEARIAMAVEMKRLNDAKVDEAVIKATYWSIKASAPVIYKDANSATASGVHTPVTVTGELRSGTTTTQGGFISIQPNGGSESTATASPRTITPTNTEGKTSYTVRLYEKADKVKLLDTMTIPVVFKGESGVNAINVSLSNEADILPASPEGVVSDYAGSGTIIRVFEGATELTYGTGNGQYQVSALGSGITAGTPSTVGNTRVYGVASNMTSDNATITFTISGKTSSGTSFSLTKVQTFAKSRVGQKGNEGEDALSVQLHRQGSFRTWWRQVSDSGAILPKPKKVSEIVGGVTVAGVRYVEVKAVIYKGSRDVTSIAMKPLAQGGGGDFKWYIVGGPNPGLKASGVDRLLLSVDYADGLDDEVQFEYNDANAKNW